MLFGSESAIVRNIRITYQSHHDAMPVTIEVAQSEYYDPLESDTHTFELDGVPKYIAPHQFVPVHPDDLKLLIITEPQSSGQREFRVQYLDGLRSYCIHSIWPDGTEELIHTTDISADTYHIIRTQKDSSGYWSVVMNTVGHSTDEVSANDRIGRYKWEQLRDFWCDIADKKAK
jgi:hypothetical protein